LLGGTLEVVKPAPADNQDQDEARNGTLVRLRVPRRNLESNAA
jgi:hypothetical protein